MPGVDANPRVDVGAILSEARVEPSDLARHRRLGRLLVVARRVSGPPAADPHRHAIGHQVDAPSQTCASPGGLCAPLRRSPARAPLARTAIACRRTPSERSRHRVARRPSSSMRADSLSRRAHRCRGTRGGAVLLDPPGEPLARPKRRDRLSWTSALTPDRGAPRRCMGTETTSPCGRFGDRFENAGSRPSMAAIGQEWARHAQPGPSARPTSALKAWSKDDKEIGSCAHGGDRRE